VRLHLDETDERIKALEDRPKNLEDMKPLDEQRIAELEGSVFSKSVASEIEVVGRRLNDDGDARKT
jgi:hypothetical protein